MRSLSLSFLLVLSCSSSAPVETVGFTAAPLVTTASATQKLTIDVRTSPQPPEVGMQSAQLVITDSATGKPVSDLSMAVVPWMPAMGHGTSIVPTVSNKGAGVYQIDQLSLFMPGEWELRLTFDGSVADTANPAFNVP
jgi:hypothetical protein